MSEPNPHGTEYIVLTHPYTGKQTTVHKKHANQLIESWSAHSVKSNAPPALPRHQGETSSMEDQHAASTPTPCSPQSMNGKRAAVIVDVDGTVADKGNRHPFDMTTVSQDSPIESIIYLVELLHYFGYQIVFVSGRFESARADTEKWLNWAFTSNVLVHDLHLRPDGDYRPDLEVKDEIYRTEIEPSYEVAYVLDDRNQTVNMWRDMHNLTTLQVAYGDF